jgi:hypothetical protein
MLGPTFVEIQSVEMLALVGGLCCVGFLLLLLLLDRFWAQLSRFHLKKGTEYSFRKAMF